LGTDAGERRKRLCRLDLEQLEPDLLALRPEGVGGEREQMWKRW
jgi:hypothetical protein